jgi:hypothetical protein
MTEAEGSSLLKGSTERTVFISYSWTQSSIANGSWSLPSDSYLMALMSFLMCGT